MAKSYYRKRVEAFERMLIRGSLKQNAGHIGETAQALGLTYRQLRHRIKVLDLRERPGKLKPFG